MPRVMQALQQSGPLAALHVQQVGKAASTGCGMVLAAWRNAWDLQGQGVVMERH